MVPHFQKGFLLEKFDIFLIAIKTVYNVCFYKKDMQTARALGKKEFSLKFMRVCVCVLAKLLIILYTCCVY